MIEKKSESPLMSVKIHFFSSLFQRVEKAVAHALFQRPPLRDREPSLSLCAHDAAHSSRSVVQGGSRSRSSKLFFSTPRCRRQCFRCLSVPPPTPCASLPVAPRRSPSRLRDGLFVLCLRPLSPRRRCARNEDGDLE